MIKIFRECFFTLLLLISPIYSLEVFVDTDFPTASGTTYPTFAEAFQSLINTNAQLIDYSNSITLQPSCASKTLATSNATLFGLSTGGSLSITFPTLSTTVSKFTDCSQLPIISITSLLRLSNLTSLSISGVAIQFSATSNTNQLYNISNVSFSNFCFNNTEPSLGSTGTLSSSLVRTFYFSQISSLSMSNGVYTYDSFKTLSVSGSTQIDLISMNYYVLATTRDLNNQGLSISATTAVTVSSMAVTCEAGSIKMPFLISASTVTSMSVAGLQISDCNFSQPISYTQNLIYYTSVLNVAMQQVLVNNTSIGTSTQSGVGYEHYLFYFYNPITGTVPTSISLADWMITNSTINFRSAVVEITIRNSLLVGSITVQNVTLSRSALYWYSDLMSIQMINYPATSLTATRRTISISQLQILQNQLQYECFVLTMQMSLPIAYASVETLQAVMQSVTFQDNVISQSTAIKGEAVLVEITGLLSQNDTLLNSSVLVESSSTVSTLFLFDSELKNMTISQTSQIVSYVVSSNLFERIELASMNQTGGYIYAQTRPLIVSNCIFSDITFENDSAAIVSTNPMVIIQGNTFSQINVSGSQLLSLGDYINFVNEVTDGITYTTISISAAGNFIASVTAYSVPTTSIFYPFLQAESVTFQGHSRAAETFYAARNISWDFDSSNSVHFLSMTDNVFQNINVESPFSLFSLSDFDFFNSSVIVKNNTLTAVTSPFSGLFQSDYVERLLWASNTVANSTINGYLLDLDTDYLYALVINSDTLKQTDGLVAYNIQSPNCGNVNMQNITAQDISFTMSFLVVACDFLANQAILNNSNFNNIAIQTTRNVLVSTNLIAIKVKIPFQGSSSATGALILQGNRLDNITLKNQEGHVTRLFDNSLILVYASNRTISLGNNTFNMITVSPIGSIMTISMPSIVITNSTFSNIFYYDPKGALNLVFETLSVSSSAFINSTGESENGAGLIKATNPRSSTENLNVSIVNCNFSNNRAPYGTLFYTTSTKITLNFSQNHLSGNFLTQSFGLVYLYEIFDSLITIQNSTFIINTKETDTSLKASIFAITRSFENVTVSVSNCSLFADSGASGSFFTSSYDNSHMFSASQFVYSPVLPGTDFSTYSYSSYSLLEADKIQASFTDLNVSKMLFVDAPLFKLNFSSSDTGSKSLQITNSNFEDLSIDEAIILIDSYGDVVASDIVDSLSVHIANSSFKNIQLSQTTATVSSSVGIVWSLTPLLGRSSNQSTSFAIEITNCSFVTINGGNGGAIFTGIESSYQRMLLLKNSSFEFITTAQENPSEVGGVIKIAADTSSSSTAIANINSASISIVNSTFRNISALNGGVISWESQTKPINVSMTGSNFSNVTVTNTGGLILANYSQTSSDPVIFSIINCSFFLMKAYDGAIFYIAGTSRLFQVALQSSSVSNVTVTNNGAILRLMDSASTASSSTLRRGLQSETTGTFNISNSQFSNIVAQNGSIVYENSTSNTITISLAQNQFDNITAQARGGILYVNQPILSVVSNNFSQAYANISGSILYASSGLLNLSDFATMNSILGANTVPTLAFAPTNLLVELIDKDTSLNLPLENYEDLSNIPIVPNLTSYSLESLYMRFTLIYVGSPANQVVIDESPSASVSITFTSTNGKDMNSYSSDKCFNSVCAFDPAGIYITGKAGELIGVSVIYKSDIYEQQQNFNIRLRACVPGEVNHTATEECVYCEAGTYSLFTSETNCNNCPDGATCHGGTNVSIKKNYYRSPTEALHLVPCNDSETRCKGGFENTCKSPYIGPACLQCSIAEDYITTDQGACTKCYDSKTVLISLAAIILTFSIVYQLFMVFMAYKELEGLQIASSKSKRGRKYVSDLKPAAFMVIFSTFTQITTIISNNYSEVTSQESSIMGTITNTSQQILNALKCLMYNKETNPIDSMRNQLLFIVFAPLAKLLLVSFFELVRNLIMSKFKHKTNWHQSLVRLGSIVVVLTILEQPGIINFLGNYLACKQLDPFVGTHYIVKSNTIECFTAEYNTLRNVLVIPALLFWGLLIPLVIFLALRINRKRLFENHDLVVILGQLYTGYTPSAYYWGLMVIVLKMGLSILDSILIEYTEIKFLIFLVIFHVFLRFSERVRPYQTLYIQKAEKYSILSYMLILTLLLLQSAIDNSAFSKIVEVLILIIKIVCEIFILIPVILLYVRTGRSAIKDFKRTLHDKKVLKETHAALAEYHLQNPQRVDKNFRRNAISLDLPLENTRVAEKKRRSHRRHKGSTILDHEQGVKFWKKLLTGATQVFKPSESLGENPSRIILRTLPGNEALEKTTKTEEIDEEHKMNHDEHKMNHDEQRNGQNETLYFHKFNPFGTQKPPVIRIITDAANTNLYTESAPVLKNNETLEPIILNLDDQNTCTFRSPINSLSPFMNGPTTSQPLRAPDIEGHSPYERIFFANEIDLPDNGEKHKNPDEAHHNKSELAEGHLEGILRELQGFTPEHSSSGSEGTEKPVSLDSVDPLALHHNPSGKYIASYHEAKHVDPLEPSRVNGKGAHSRTSSAREAKTSEDNLDNANKIKSLNDLIH